jgi:hypothetical protein
MPKPHVTNDLAPVTNKASLDTCHVSPKMAVSAITTAASSGISLLSLIQKGCVVGTNLLILYLPRVVRLMPSEQ